MQVTTETAARRAEPVNERNIKRQLWLTRAWKRTASGDSFLYRKGFSVTVSQQENGWALTVKQAGKVCWSGTNFRTKESAKLAAFDQITDFLQNPAKPQRDSDDGGPVATT